MIKKIIIFLLILVALSSSVYALTCSSSPCSVDSSSHNIFDYFYRDYLDNSAGCGQSGCSTANQNLWNLDAYCFKMDNLHRSWLRFSGTRGDFSGDLKIYIDDVDVSDCDFTRYSDDRQLLMTIPWNEGSSSTKPFVKEFDLESHKTFLPEDMFHNPDCICTSDSYYCSGDIWQCILPSGEKKYSYFFDFEDTGWSGDWNLWDINLDTQWRSSSREFNTPTITFSDPISNIKSPKLKFYLDGYQHGNIGTQTKLNIRQFFQGGGSMIVYSEAKDFKGTETVDLTTVDNGMYFEFYIDGQSGDYEISNIEVEYTIPECSSDADCGDPWYGDNYCEDNYVKRNYDTPTCNDAGTINANCVYPESTQIIEDCYNRDGCNGEYYDYYSCSNAECYVSNWDDCIDCSCSCGGYNTDESTANGNCNDGKDNDCDGNTDGADSGCVVCVCSSGACCDGCHYYKASDNHQCSTADSCSGDDLCTYFVCDGTLGGSSACTLPRGCVDCGNKDCDVNNYHFISGTNSPSETSYCKYRNYQDCNKPCSAAACQDCSCTSYSDSTQATAGLCKYIDGCSGSNPGTAKNYHLGELCNSNKACDANGNCNIIVKKFNITLIQGWNLISFPVDMMDKTFGDIFNHFSKIFVYYLKWFELDNNDKIYEQFGYWVKVDNDYVLEIFGKEFTAPPDYNIQQGWNLVGYTLLDETNITDRYFIASYVNSSWITYSPNRTFNSLQTAKPGYGYWVKVS